MGTIVASRRHLAVWLCAAVMGPLGCGRVTDPSAPCDSVDLGEAEPGTMVSRAHAPILAVTTEQPFVLRYVCNDGAEESCTLEKTELENLGPGNQVMITSSGRFVVAIDRDQRRLRWYELDEHATGVTDSGEFPLTDEAPFRLVTSLRGSDWLVVRDAEQRLRRYMPGTTYTVELAPGLDNLTLVAAGEQHVVARQVLDNDNEALWLVPVDESLPHINHGPVRMGEFDRLDQVVLTPGDSRVLVTNGEGKDAFTSVFAAPGGWVDRFSGSLADARRRHETLPGMHAISPDGSHVAYRTASGAVAMRDLDAASSCLVRSATAGDHRLAAFSAQGVLYMESSSGPGETAVSAWDPADRRLWSLSGTDDGYRLAQVPAGHRDPSDPPWAVGVRNGAHAALQQDAAPASLELDATLFLPRDGTAVWTLHGEDTGNGSRRLSVRRIEPAFDVTSRNFEFEKTLPTGAGTDPTIQLTAQELVCMSTGTPGAWDYRCGKGSSSTFFSGKTTPPSETDAPSTNDAEVPEPLGNGLSCGSNGISLADAGSDCAYLLRDEGCCYDDKIHACVALGCGDAPCVEVVNDGQTELECGVAAGP